MNKIKQFLYAKGILTNAPYKKINSIDELLQLPFESIPNYKRVHHVDLSGLDLSKEKDMFTGPLPKYYVSPEEAKKLKIVTNWTTGNLRKHRRTQLTCINPVKPAKAYQ